ncbi:MAG: hypothetical protein LBR94_09160 [Desulfovibrio sp.]|jgi:hypothetical protein|nr:hypothetical protein [Desulfovibrio sp.]
MTGYFTRHEIRPEEHNFIGIEKQCFIGEFPQKAVDGRRIGAPFRKPFRSWRSIGKSAHYEKKKENPREYSRQMKFLFR